MKNDFVFDELVKLHYQKADNQEVSRIADNGVSSSEISDAFGNYLSSLINDDSDFYKAMIGEELNNATFFHNHLDNIYHFAFQQFRAYINLSLITSNDYFLQDIPIVESNKEKITLIKILNGLAIRIAREVLCLLENGFPHGAVARWRSIYETWIIIEYISLHDNAMAIKFINQKKSANNYSWAKSNKFKPNANGNYTFELLQKYIHEELDKNSSIKSTEGFLYSDWKNEYKLSNKILHIDSMGIFGYWDTLHKNQNNQLYTNASDAGFLKPASNTLACLYNINRVALSSLKTENDIFALFLLRKLCDKAVESFEKANSQS